VKNQTLYFENRKKSIEDKISVILIFQRTLAHYRLGIFREINKVTGAILCFGKNGPKGTFLSKVRPDFKYYQVRDYYPIRKKDTFVVQDILTPLFKFKPTVVITEFALGIISNYLLLLLRPFLRYKLILWSHGYNRKKGFHPQKSFADKLRVWWMNRADAVILYGQEGKKIVAPYIKDNKKIFVAQNTLDTISLLKIRDRLDKVGKEGVKKQIGFTKRYNLIYMGRLLKEKEPDRLIDVYKIISKKIDNIELHIVGNGPIMGELKTKIKKLKNEDKNLKIRFWGVVTDDVMSGMMLYASDLMVMPGYLGLSVVHSFCFDCPVVSQKQGVNGPFHSPEIEYVIDGKTGFLVPYDNNELMAETIVEYLLDKVKLNEMKQEIRNMVEKVCSLDNMINGFREAIEYIKGENG